MAAFVSRSEWFFSCSSFNNKTFIVVIVESVEGISIVYYYIEKGLSVGCSSHILKLKCASYHLNQLAEFAQLVTTEPIIDGITFD